MKYQLKADSFDDLDYTDLAFEIARALGKVPADIEITKEQKARIAITHQPTLLNADKAASSLVKGGDAVEISFDDNTKLWHVKLLPLKPASPFEAQASRLSVAFWILFLRRESR